MTTNIMEFNYYGFAVRSLKDETSGEPWFVAKDLCKVLNINNVAMAVRELDTDEKGISNIDTPGGNQRMTVVNESGLYFFILKSRKPEAKAFKKWVTSQVLPSIRKHGGYVQGQEQEEDSQMLMAKALKVAESVITEKDKKLEQQREMLEESQAPSSLTSPQEAHI